MDVRAACDARTLEDAISGRTLVICDVEGYEATLLAPAASPGLARATVLVELHEAASPGVGHLLRRRFAATHEWSEFPSRDRDPAEFPTSHFLAAADRPLA